MQLRSILDTRAVASVVALLALVLVVAGCTAGMPGAQPMAAATAQQQLPVPTPEPGKLTVVDVRARPAPLEGGNGAAYMTVLNGLDTPVRLASVAGDASAAIELHESVNDNGVMKMEPHPKGFEIPPSGTLELKPGGKHVMMVGLVKPLAVGDSFELMLNFEGSAPMKLTVPVLEMEATMPGMDHGAMPMGTETPIP
jgi:copper(I)-binding protein